MERTARLEPSADAHRISLTSDRRIPLGLRDELVTTGDHIAYFWETPTEFREAVGFLDVGLERGDLCVIFGHAEGNRRVCAVLADLLKANEAEERAADAN